MFNNNPVFYAVSGLIFGLVNTVLWFVLWRVVFRNSSEKDNTKKIEEALKKMNDGFRQELGRLTKIEDQLWGVLDRMKEMEKGIAAFSSASEVEAGVPEDIKKALKENADVLGTVESWAEKGAVSVSEASGSSTAKDLAKELEPVFRALKDNIQWLRKGINNEEF